MNSRQFAIIIVITFFVGMVWVGADIIFNTKASIEISDKLQVLLEPVNPNFNERVLKSVDEETRDTSSITVTDAVLPDLPVSIAESSSPSANLDQ